MPRPAAGSERRRQARSVRNDAHILDAALHLTDRDGWRGLAVAQVAEAAGLARPSVLTRFKDRPAVGAGLWTALLAEPLRSALSNLIEASSEAAPTPSALWEAFMPFAHPGQRMRAAAELLIVGRYEPTVGAAIAETLEPEITRWLAPGKGQAKQAAVRAHACNVAFGLLIEARRHSLEGADFGPEMIALAEAYAATADPVPLPKANARHLDSVANFDTGDEELNILLRATLEQVASRGYEGATIEHIARAAGRTPGFIFSRYDSKRALFLDANWKYSERAAALTEEFMRKIAEATSDHVAEAVATRELMRPERRQVMTFALELYRLSWHDQDVLHAIDAGYADVVRQHSEQAPKLTPGQNRAWLVMELARGNGPLLLAGLSDTAWKLPYDVVFAAPA